MKKIMFGIYAHPDDETVGAAGILKQETTSGTELYILTLTDGNAGNNPDGHDNLGEVRREECQNAGRILGAKNIEFLGYEDGRLNNQAMLEIGQHLMSYVSGVVEAAPKDAEIEFTTLDLNGYTGHIDHIIAARAATKAFFTLKQSDPRFTRIRYACLPKHLYPADNLEWVYMEAGRRPEEIDEILDTREFRRDIEDAMNAHYSQRHDCQAAREIQGDELGLYYLMNKS